MTVRNVGDAQICPKCGRQITVTIEEGRFFKHRASRSTHNRGTSPWCAMSGQVYVDPNKPREAARPAPVVSAAYIAVHLGDQILYKRDLKDFRQLQDMLDLLEMGF